MENNRIKLLDCTLRDGGFVNDWYFGHDNIINIFERLVEAEIDIIEIGFLDERREADTEHTIQPGGKQLDAIYRNLDKGNAMIVGMIDYGTCGIERIEPCEHSFMDGIRVIFKKEKRREAIAFCGQIKKLGYQVFVQAVSITSYNDEELEDLIGLVNDLEPYAFSLVDTYGLLHRRQLLHYFSFADERLKKTIGLGYHSHNNFQLGYANCIELLEQEMNRQIIIDGSLYGMGKSAGNTPIELLVDYMNHQEEGRYQSYHLLEAIDVTIREIYKQIPWGYSYKFFLSASNDCHPNYVSYLLDKKKLSAKSISEILKEIPEEKKLNFDAQLIERMYVSYQQNVCDDTEDVRRLAGRLSGREIVLLGPGRSIEAEKERIQAYIRESGAITISINFMPDIPDTDFIFISNAKRYVQLSTKLKTLSGFTQLMATSNVTGAAGTFHYVLSYSRLLDETAMIVDNPMIMLMRLLNEISVQKIVLAGFDGYEKSESTNYVNPNMEQTFSREKAEEINEDVRRSLKRLQMKVPYEFLTETRYREVTGYKLVIFDLDGTLLDTTEGVLNAVRYTIEECGLAPLSEEILQTFIGPPIQDSFGNAYGIEDTHKLQELATVFRNRYKDYELYKAKPYPGIYETCEALKEAGILLAVATYKREDYAIDIMRYFGFDQYMAAIYGADHDNKLKKSDIIQKCLDLLDQLPGQTDKRDAIMVGDTVNDSMGAQKAGVDFVGVTYGFGFRDRSELALPCCVGCADSAKELGELIRRLS